MHKNTYIAVRYLTSIGQVLAGAAHRVMVDGSAEERNLSWRAILVFYARFLSRRRIGEITIAAVFTHCVRF